MSLPEACQVLSEVAASQMLVCPYPCDAMHLAVLRYSLIKHRYNIWHLELAVVKHPCSYRSMRSMKTVLFAPASAWTAKFLTIQLLKGSSRSTEAKA